HQHAGTIARAQQQVGGDVALLVERILDASLGDAELQRRRGAGIADLRRRDVRRRSWAPKQRPRMRCPRGTPRTRPIDCKRMAFPGEVSLEPATLVMKPPA